MTLSYNTRRSCIKTFSFACLLIPIFYISCNEKDTFPFTIIVLPDTQIYSQDTPEWRPSSLKEVFMSQTMWIKDHKEEENIVFVFNMGDIVNRNGDDYQWQNANECMSVLDGIVPYCFAVGNHDMGIGDTQSTRDTTPFNTYFPYTRYESEEWYGGHIGNNNDNSYYFFSAGGMEFMVVSLEFGPTDEMLNWANYLVSSYPDRRVIVITHCYMLNDNTRVDNSDPYPPISFECCRDGNNGEQIWDKFIKLHANIFMVLSGHETDVGLLTSTGIHGNKVHQLLNGEDYDGWLRIFKVIPTENRISVKSYSPWLKKYNTDEAHQFDLELPGKNELGDFSYHEQIFSEVNISLSKIENLLFKPDI